MTKLEPRNDGVTNTLTSVQKDNLLADAQREEPARTMAKDAQQAMAEQLQYFYDDEGHLCFINEEGKTVYFRIRKLTERECFRLMGLRDDEIDKLQAAGIPRSQQYKLAGNSIVVDVMGGNERHNGIFGNLFFPHEAEQADRHGQLSLF